jgi:dTMP kinase
MSEHETHAPFIVLEGIDGAGTTTQSALLKERFAANGQSAVLTREPSDGPIGVMIRQMLSRRIVLPVDATRGGIQEPMTRQTLALLFAADRLDHVAATIDPASRAGKPVISDRYYHSSLAYQGDVEAQEDGTERVDYDWILSLNSRARVPDITFFLEIDIETSLERLGRRAARDIYETREKLERLITRYNEVIALLEERGHPIVKLDATASIDALSQQIWDRVTALPASRTSS